MFTDICGMSVSLLEETFSKLVKSSVKVDPSIAQCSTTADVLKNSLNETGMDDASVETCNMNSVQGVADKMDGAPALVRRSCRLTSKRFDALELLGIKRDQSEIRKENTHIVKKLICKRSLGKTNSLVSADKDERAAESCQSILDAFGRDSPMVCGDSVSYLDVSSSCKIENGLVDSGGSLPEFLPDQESWQAYGLTEVASITELETAQVPMNTLVIVQPMVETSNNSETVQGTVCKEENLGSLEISEGYLSICEGLNTTETCSLETAAKKAAEPVYGNLEIWNGTSHHICKFCNKTFERQSYLARHIQGHINEFLCTKCNKKFSRAETLASHVCQRMFPTDGVVHQCKFCAATFRMEKYLVRHLATHSEDFKCRDCQRSFSRKESLLQHIARCHPDIVGSGGEMQMYPCKQCNRVFTKELSLQNHMKLHSNSFKCHTCAKAFSSSFSLTRHSCVGDVVAQGLACETDDGCFECKQCGKILSQRAALRRHLAAHQDSFSCTVCGKTHSRKEEIAKHELECSANAELIKSGFVECNICHLALTNIQEFSQHHKQHTHPHKCDACGRRFLRQANCDDHRCSVTEDSLVKCDVCNKKFSNIRYLQRHSALHAERRHVCERCGRRFNRLDYLHDHVCVDVDGHRVRIRRTRNSEEVIQGQNAVVCPVCGKNYTSISNLNKHLKTHGEKKEVCDVCGKQFHLKVLLKEHVKYVHSDTYAVECPHCSKQMKSRNSLYGHIALFHPDLSQKKVITYKCSQCGKVFRQKGNLKKHELTHSDKHSYACKQCEKTFKFPEQMRRHELWHQHGARHQCQMCDRQFVMEFELRKHIETFHGGAVFICKYCQVVCHHQQAMKRHLQRCHFNIDEWQTTGPEFIKSLQVYSDTYTNVKQTLMPQAAIAKHAEVEEIPPDSNGKTVGVSPHDLTSIASNFKTVSGTVILTKMGEGSINGSVLPNPPMAFVLQTTPSETASFNPESSTAHSNTAETLNGNPAINAQSIISFTDLGYADGLIQLPVSITESSAPIGQGSEYIFVSITNNTSKI